MRKWRKKPKINKIGKNVQNRRKKEDKVRQLVGYECKKSEKISTKCAHKISEKIRQNISHERREIYENVRKFLKWEFLITSRFLMGGFEDAQPIFIKI